jgi:hypothetical protein
MNQTYKPLMIGLWLVVIIGIFELIVFSSCKNNLLCVVLGAIPVFPGVILGLERYALISISLIFWFLLGSLIGYLIYKIKNK